MFSLKSKIFNYLTTHQKSEFCKHIQLFTKKRFNLSAQEITDNLIDEENYYLEVGQSRIKWIEDYINDDKFITDTCKFVSESKYKFEQKVKMAPLIEKQKEYAKVQRKKNQEYKMSKDQPTSKQLYYFKQLCKKNTINDNIINIEFASKLDIKNAINELLQEKSKESKEQMLIQLSDLIEENRFS
jgi:hypothetical protein